MAWNQVFVVQKPKSTETSSVGKRLRPQRLLLAGALMVSLWGQSASSAELVLRHECRCSGTLLLLGDVAAIHAGDADEARELAAVELFPAPLPGKKRFVRARQVQDILALRGLDLAKCRLSGANQVEVRGSDVPITRPDRPTSLSSLVVRQATEAAREAIVRHLRETASQAESWQVELELTEAQARWITACQGSLAARGGTSPWLGQQLFVLEGEPSTDPEQLGISARVGTVPAVVVAARSLPSGTIVSEADLQLASGKPGAGQEDQSFRRLEDVAGLETRRAVAAGHALTPDDLRGPLLVRRRDAVTVYVRRAGVKVRTMARALEEGGHGELITVESLLNKQTYFARVTGIQVVEAVTDAVTRNDHDKARTRR